MRITIINGPNLNLLGKREPSIYGTRSMEQVLVEIQRAYPEVHFEYKQSNHEGDLIDWVQEMGIAHRLEDAHNSLNGDWTASPIGRSDELLDKGEIAGIVLNAGGYTHTSIALRDAVACAEIPVVEVHISDITKREGFRQVSLLTDVCAHSIMGHGTDGYQEAVEWIINHNK